MGSSKFGLRGFAVAAAVALAAAGCSDGGEPTDTGAPATAGGNQTDTDSPTAGGQSSGSAPSDTATDGSSGQQATPPDADLREVNFAVGAQKALEISADEVGSEGIVHAIEIDYSRHHQAWKWSVKTLVSGTDHEVDINADTGEILEKESESSDDTEKPISLTDPMTPQQAQELALAKVDGPIRGWKLEWDDGVKAYQFDIDNGQGDEVEVTVNVADGSVTIDS